MAEGHSDNDIFSLIEKRQWDSVLDVIKRNPEVADKKSPVSENPTLHEMCKNQPTAEVVKTILDAKPGLAEVKGQYGYLPLHYACVSAASNEVISILVDSFPAGTRAFDDNEKLLAIHLGCKWGADQDVLMTLLKAYPGSMNIQDNIGKAPMDYIMMIPEQKVTGMKEAHTSYIDRLSSRHRNEINDLNETIGTLKQSLAAERAKKSNVEGQFKTTVSNLLSNAVTEQQKFESKAVVLNKDIEKLQASLCSEQKKALDYKKQIGMEREKQESIMTELTEEIENLRGEIFSDHEKTLNLKEELNKTINCLRGDVDAEKSINAELALKLATTLKELEAAHHRIKEEKQISASYKSALRDAMSTIEKNRGEFAKALDKERNEFKKTLEMVGDEFDAVESRHRSTIDELHSQVKNVREEILVEEVNNVSIEQEYETEIARLRLQVRNTQHKLNEAIALFGKERKESEEKMKLYESQISSEKLIILQKEEENLLMISQIKEELAKSNESLKTTTAMLENERQSHSDKVQTLEDKCKAERDKSRKLKKQSMQIKRESKNLKKILLDFNEKVLGRKGSRSMKLKRGISSSSFGEKMKLTASIDEDLEEDQSREDPSVNSEGTGGDEEEGYGEEERDDVIDFHQEEFEPENWNTAAYVKWMLGIEHLGTAAGFEGINDSFDNDDSNSFTSIQQKVHIIKPKKTM